MAQTALRFPVRRRVPAGRFVLAVVLAAALGIGGAAGVHALVRRGPALALPAFNGAVVWNRGERPTPEVVLRDQSGARFALSSLKGRSIMLAFLGTRCGGACAAEAQSLTQAMSRAGKSRPALVLVGYAGDTAAGARAAARRWHLPAGVHWLTGTRPQLARVWHAFGVPVVRGAPAHVVYLIDRAGYERTGYLFPFLPNVVGRDLRALAEGS